jgi:hypothetical protein
VKIKQYIRIEELSLSGIKKTKKQRKRGACTSSLYHHLQLAKVPYWLEKPVFFRLLFFLIAKIILAPDRYKYLRKCSRRSINFGK